MLRESHELLNLDEFRAVVGVAVGAIAITDTTGRRVHLPTCRHVTDSAFTEKVVTNARKNGRYYYFLRVDDAERLLDAKRCGTCLPPADAGPWAWVEGAAQVDAPHFVLYHDGQEKPVARIGPAADGAFVVHFLGAEREGPVVDAVRHEIDYYLVELEERDPWEYAIYHCGTVSNAYPPVHWSYVEPSR